mmetsp:Transcript_8902/g.24197  ORF Transcript_8902/g.24197 Transcript_8902/m.24197 type:complete len:390 (-) Transcript_8902:762-1931(-)
MEERKEGGVKREDEDSEERRMLYRKASSEESCLTLHTPSLLSSFLFPILQHFIMRNSRVWNVTTLLTTFILNVLIVLYCSKPIFPSLYWWNTTVNGSVMQYMSTAYNSAGGTEVMAEERQELYDPLFSGGLGGFFEPTAEGSSSFSCSSGYLVSTFAVIHFLLSVLRIVYYLIGSLPSVRRHADKIEELSERMQQVRHSSTSPAYSSSSGGGGSSSSGSGGGGSGGSKGGGGGGSSSGGEGVTRDGDENGDLQGLARIDRAIVFLPPRPARAMAFFVELFFSAEGFPHWAFLLLGLIGLLLAWVRPVMYSTLLIFDVIRGNTLMKYVLSAVVSSRAALGQTGLLAIMIIYVFTAIGFLFFADEYIDLGDEFGCDSMLSCIAIHMNFGLR